MSQASSALKPSQQCHTQATLGAATSEDNTHLKIFHFCLENEMSQSLQNNQIMKGFSTTGFFATLRGNIPFSKIANFQ